MFDYSLNLLGEDNIKFALIYLYTYFERFQKTNKSWNFFFFMIFSYLWMTYIQTDALRLFNCTRSISEVEITVDGYNDLMTYVDRRGFQIMQSRDRIFDVCLRIIRWTENKSLIIINRSVRRDESIRNEFQP